MELYGPDSLRSWIVVILAGLVQISVLFSLKTMGITFLGFLNEWHITRQEASWPLTLFITSSQLFAPILPLLQRLLPASSVLPLSCLFSSLSLMLSYFATNLVQMSVVLAIHGIWLAAIYIFSTLLVMQHFQQKRTAANAVASTISTASTIFASNAMETLIGSFGVRNALVIVGAAGLGLVPFAFGLRTPKWYSQKTEKTPKLDRRPSVEVEADDLLDSEKGRSASAETSSSRSGRSLDALSRPRRPLLLSPLFAAHAISVTVTYTSMNLFLLLACDHASDMNVAKGAVSYVVPMYCIGDLLARLSSGIIIDCKVISWQTVLALGYSVEAICLVAWVNSSSTTVLLGLAFVVGCTCGAKVTLVPVQLMNDFGLPRLVLCSGAALCICGIVTLSRPWFIGFFWSAQHSHRGVFLIVAAFCSMCAVYWIVRAVRVARKSSDTKETEKALQVDADTDGSRTSAKMSEV